MENGLPGLEDRLLARILHSSRRTAVPSTSAHTTSALLNRPVLLRPEILDPGRRYPLLRSCYLVTSRLLLGSGSCSSSPFFIR